MTGADLIYQTRLLLHDTGAGFSADNPFYTTPEIIDSLTNARTELVRLLSGSPSPPYVTLAQMTKTVLATTGGAVPTDFYKLICGFNVSTLTYMPAVSIRLGEATKNVPIGQVYVKARTFQGFNDLLDDFALYWAFPSQAIADTGVTLSEFGDEFYYAVKYQAAMNLLAKEEDDAWTRYASLQEGLQRKIMSFR